LKWTQSLRCPEPGSVEAAHEVTFDAHCVQPQTLAFDADNDDLFADSDAPNQ
jgi:hypothetical protein